MAQVVWSLRAQKDLQEIFEFISKDSELYALNTIDTIVKRTSLLASNVNLGRMVPELNRADIREVLEGNYRIIYYVKAGKVLISRVYHRSRLFKTP